MNQSAAVHAVRIGTPKQRTSAGARKEWMTAFEKPPAETPVWIGTADLRGNQVADPSVHGGPERAVLFYALSNYDYWERELGVPAAEGFERGFAENITAAGLDEHGVCVGDIFQLGDAIVEIAQPRSPCWKIGEYWGIKDLSKRVYLTGKTGWFARVKREGLVKSGDALVLQERPNPLVTIHMLNKVVAEIETRRADIHEYAELIDAFANCETLSPGWRKQFQQADWAIKN